MPIITVLMPVYNDEKYIRDSIDSVLGQTFTDFEFLIIDDGSTDSTADIIKSYADPRIQYIKNENNVGLTKSLNRGLAFARGEYIARHDSDDRMEESRLEKQLSFLENNPNVVMVGAYYKTINEKNEIIGIFPWPLGFENNLFNVLTGDNPVSTILIKTNIINQIRYSEQYVQAQDIDLYLRTYAAGFKSDNIPEYLNFIRIHDQQISNTAKSKQRNNHIIAFHDFYKRFTKREIQYDKVEEYLNILVWQSEKINSKNIESLINIFLELFSKFQSIHGLNYELKNRFLKRIVYDFNNLYYPNSLLSIFEIFIKKNLPIMFLIKLVLKRVIKELKYLLNLN